MKRLILFSLLLNSAFGFCQTAEFSFLSPTTHQWEDTKEGVVLEHYFVFTNSGEEPLIIEGAEVACNCTTVEYPKQPIFPQAKDSILVRFDTDQTYYKQNRKIVVKANTKKEAKLRIKVFVIPREE